MAHPLDGHNTKNPKPSKYTLILQGESRQAGVSQMPLNSSFSSKVEESCSFLYEDWDFGDNPESHGFIFF